MGDTLNWKEMQSQIVVGLILLVVSFFLGFFGHKYLSQREARIRYLEFDIQFRSFEQPTVSNKKLELFIEGQKVEKPSEITVSIYNLTDRDFDNVPLYVEISFGESVVKVIDEPYVVGSNKLQESVEVNPNINPSTKTGALRYGYTLKTSNRSDHLDPVFQARYLISGAINPSVEVKTHKKGLKLRKLSLPSQGIGRISISAFFIGLLIFIIMLLIYLIVNQREKVKRAEARRVLQDRLDALDKIKESAESGVPF